MTKASGGQTGTKGVPPPQSPAKAASPATKYSPSPKKEKEGKKLTLRRLSSCPIQMLHLLVGHFMVSTMRMSFLNRSLTGIARPPTLRGSIQAILQSDNKVDPNLHG